MVAYFYLNKVDEAGDRLQRWQDWERRHAAFHEALLVGCLMVLLLQFCLMLNRLKDRYRRLFRDLVASSVKTREVPAEHRQMLDVCLARDETTAQRLLQFHIQTTGDHLLQLMRRQAEKPARRRTATARPAS